MKRGKLFSNLKLRTIPLVLATSLLLVNVSAIDSYAEGDASTASSDITTDAGDSLDTVQKDIDEDKNEDDDKGSGGNDNANEGSCVDENGEGGKGNGAKEGDDKGSASSSSSVSASSTEGSSNDEVVKEGSTEASSSTSIEESDASDSASSESSEDASDEASSEDSKDDSKDKTAERNGYVHIKVVISGDDSFTISGPKYEKVVENGTTTHKAVSTSISSGEEGDFRCIDNKVVFSFKKNAKRAFDLVAFDGDSSKVIIEGNKLTCYVDDLEAGHTLSIEVSGEDNTPAVVENVKFSNKSIEDIDKTVEYTTTDKNELTVSAHVYDVGTNGSKPLGVSKVVITYKISNRTKTVIMKELHEGSGEYFWTPDSYGSYELLSIKAYDKAGNNPAEMKLGVKARLSRTADGNYLEIKPSKIDSTGWYSFNENNLDGSDEGVVFEISGTSNLKISGIYVTDKEVTSVGGFNKLKNATYIPLTEENLVDRDGMYEWNITAPIPQEDKENVIYYAYAIYSNEQDTVNAAVNSNDDPNAAGSSCGTNPTASKKLKDVCLSASTDGISCDSCAPALGEEGIELKYNEDNGKGFNKILNWIFNKQDITIYIDVNVENANVEFNRLEFNLNGDVQSIDKENAKPIKNDKGVVTHYRFSYSKKLNKNESNVFRVTEARLVDRANNYVEAKDKQWYFYHDGIVPTASISVVNADGQDTGFAKNQFEIVVTIKDETCLDFDEKQSIKVQCESELGSDYKIDPYVELMPEASGREYEVDEDGYKRLVSVVYKAVVSLDAECEGKLTYVLYGSEYKDKANHKGCGCVSDSIEIDNVGPKIKVDCGPLNPSTEDGSVYYSDGSSGIEITIKDLHPDFEAMKNAIVVKHNGNSIQGEWPSIDPNYRQESYTVKFSTSEEGKYEIEINEAECLDLAGNPGHLEEEYVKEFFVDNTEPVLDPISFDNNNVMHDKYYNKERVATITVHDYSLSTKNSKIEVKSKYGEPVISEWSGTDTDYDHTATVTFAEDGIYSFTVTVYDKAGHGGQTLSVEEFIIDTTAPKVDVAYSNNAVKNQIYYKEARTATLSIEDLSFSSELVEYGMQPISDGDALPTIGSFTTSDLVNTTHMNFDKDGKYAYVINCTDLAGNTSTSYISDVFVIDTTVPEVTFSGVENYSANNGTVAPTVKYVDKNMDMDATVVTMTGSNNGVVSVGSAVTETEDGFVVSYNDFAHDKSMDDLYVLKATVVDMAGNESEEELVFSVNRFGSVFVLGDDAKVLNDSYYTNDPKDITITEINVDELTYRDVSISRDGEITELKRGDDYTVTAQGSDTSWKTYTYTLSKENFQKDGIYSVTVYTQDKASNKQDNKSRDAEISFAVDLTNPSIVTSGVDSNATYKEKNHNVNVSVSDNMGLTQFKVYRDEKEIGSYTAEELEKSGGSIQLTLPEADKKPFNLKMVAVDVAGNEQEIVYSNVTIATENTVIKKEDPPKDDGDKDKPDNKLWVFVIIGLGAVAAASGAGLYAYKIKVKNG